MEKNNLHEAGEQIKNIVQNAVDSGDFSKLSESIVDVVNDAVDGIQDTLRSINTNGKYEYSGQAAAERIRQELEEKRKQAAQIVKTRQEEASYPSEVPGTIFQIIGAILLAVNGVPAILGAIISLVAMDIAMLAVSLAMFGPLTWFGYWLFKKGRKQKLLARHFRRFKKILGPRTFCKVSELAAGVGITHPEAAKELREMLNKNWWKEGFMDAEDTMFMTDRETYNQYRETAAAFEQRKEQQKAAAYSESDTKADEVSVKSAADNDSVPEKSRAIIREGQKYIRHIHECNDKIPGEEISRKLDRLEHTVSRIFTEVEKNPSSADDLHKLMNYYLPTTAKLLDAYCELEQQNVSGKNIDGTKKEIEKALDTINAAFENLLDSMFQTQAWDISSDISVLNTMLAQEGLTGSELDRMMRQG